MKISAMKDLLDAMEDTPSGFLDANDLGTLYNELSDSVYGLSVTIDDDLLRYEKDEYGIIK